MKVTASLKKQSGVWAAQACMDCVPVNAKHAWLLSVAGFGANQIEAVCHLHECLTTIREAVAGCSYAIFQVDEKLKQDALKSKRSRKASTRRSGKVLLGL